MVWKYVSLIFIILIFIIVFFIVLGLITYFSKAQKKNVDPGSVQYANSLSPNTWGATMVVTPCGLYQFTGGVVTIGSQTYQDPPSPTLSFDIISGVTVDYNFPPCIDQDQLLAAKVQHTCQGATGVVSGCYLENGNLASPGATADYYTNVGCPNIPACSGTLSLISVGYTSVTNLNQCLTVSGNDVVLTGQGACSILDQDQIFRVTLQTSTDAQNTVVTTGTTTLGSLAQFYDRETNLCVAPTSATSGASLVLSACQGYPWILVPPFSFTGSTGFTGYAGFTGGTGYTGAILSPQQIAYANNLDIASIPPFGTLAFAEYIVSNNIMSLMNTGAQPVLDNFYFYPDTSTDNYKYDAQYFSIMNYNSLNGIALCTDTLQTGCSSF